MSDTYIGFDKDGNATSFVGYDATMLLRAMYLMRFIGLYAKTGIIPTRGVTITKMLAMAGEYTGKRYKRGQYQQAQDDLKQWIDAMKAAMPTVQEG